MTWTGKRRNRGDGGDFRAGPGGAGEGDPRGSRGFC